MSNKRWDQILNRSIKSNDAKALHDLLLKNSKLQNYLRTSKGRFFLLTRAMDCKNEAIIELIVSFLYKFADLGIKKHDLQEFLFTAVVNGDVKLAELLLKKGAKLNNADWQDVNLLACRIFHHGNRKEMLELLVNHGLNVKRQNEDGRNLFRHFIPHVKKTDQDFAEIVEIFIRSGINLNEPDLYGITPLQHAVNNANSGFISYLIDRGANVNGKDKADGTALHDACRKCNLEVINLLIRKGAEISSVNIKGETPFYQLWDLGNDKYVPCSRAMVKELAKLVFENITIYNLDSILIQQNPDDKEYFDSCLAELEKMSKSKFHSHYTYFSILKMSKNIKKMAFLTKNKEFLKNFKENLHELSCYGDELKSIVNEAINYNNRLVTTETRLIAVFGKYFPRVVIRVLANNLRPEDLPLEC